MENYNLFFGKFGDFSNDVIIFALGLLFVLLEKGVLPRKRRDNDYKPSKLFFWTGCVMMIGAVASLIMKFIQ